MTRIVSKRSFVEIPRRSRMVLGQRGSPNLLSKPEAESSFSGRISELALWREELVPEEIQRMARRDRHANFKKTFAVRFFSSRCESISTRGVVLNWDVDDYERSQVIVEEVRGKFVSFIA